MHAAPIHHSAAPTAAPATIVVSLPAEAKLTIDDATTKATSAQRVFTTPELNAGKDYNYSFKAEWTVAGKPVVVTKTVTVVAGKETNVTFEAPASVAAR